MRGIVSQMRTEIVLYERALGGVRYVRMRRQREKRLTIYKVLVYVNNVKITYMDIKYNLKKKKKYNTLNK